MSRLIVVSNRTPNLSRAADTGGLAVALRSALDERGGLWFGWSGKVANDAQSQVRLAGCGNIKLATIDLNVADYESYYAGFSNSALWPLFHYRIGLSVFDPAHYEGYRRVNKRMAAALAPLLRADDTIWIHDYHLIPLARELRALGCNQKIGFFLHIPFPRREVLSALPSHDELMKTMLAYDLVGFQTEDDKSSFLDYFDVELGMTVSADGVVHAGRDIVKAAVFPIGIDVEGFADLAASAERSEAVDLVPASTKGQALVLGVDRLDYTKGIPERLQAFGRLLDDHKELRGQVSLLQITPPSRSDVLGYQAIQAEVETLCGHINGCYAELHWTPIKYIGKAYGRRDLAQLLRLSRIGLVTPLRDGMNLVAKEFVAAQDPDDPGVLVLSRFAGAAKQLSGALLVNPHDSKQVAAAISEGLSMPLAERKRRWRDMMSILEDYTLDDWVADFLVSLAACKRADSCEGTKREFGDSILTPANVAGVSRDDLGRASGF